MKTPLKVFEDLPNHYAETNAAFSPDEQLIFTGTSIEKDGDNGGLLCFFDRKRLELVSRVGISPHYSVIRCLWHPRINQVFFPVVLNEFQLVNTYILKNIIKLLCFSFRCLLQLGIRKKVGLISFMILLLVRGELLYVLDEHQGKSPLMTLRCNLSYTIHMHCHFSEINQVVNVKERRY